MSKLHDPLSLARQAAAEYEACYGVDLVSLIVFGSAAGDDFDPDSSDVNLLIVLAEVGLESLGKSRLIQQRWMKRRFSRPLFMDREYIDGSLDSFPIEFLNMKERYELLYGEDVLAGVHVDLADLRLQIERELKGKWIHLLQGWLEADGNARLLLGLLQASMRDFTAAFRACSISNSNRSPGTARPCSGR